MKKVKVGFFQELQGDGSVANSWIRMLSLLFFILLCGFILLSFRAYQSNLALFTKLLQDKSITEQSFNVLVLQTKSLDWNVLLLFVTATVAPKVIQKFAEAKSGIKDSTESIIKTASSEQIINKTS